MIVGFLPAFDSKMFKGIKFCFLVDDPKRLTKQTVVHALQRKILKMESEPERNEYGINNVHACLNFLNTKVSEDQWIFMDTTKRTRNLVLDPPDFSMIIKFHIMDFEDLRTPSIPPTKE
jgi:hypothetical protein